MKHLATQALAEYVTVVANSTFWAQLRAAPGQTMDWLLEHPIMMMVIIVGVMLVANLAKHKPR